MALRSSSATIRRCAGSISEKALAWGKQGYISIDRKIGQNGREKVRNRLPADVNFEATEGFREFFLAQDYGTSSAKAQLKGLAASDSDAGPDADGQRAGAEQTGAEGDDPGGDRGESGSRGNGRERSSAGRCRPRGRRPRSARRNSERRGRGEGEGSLRRDRLRQLLSGLPGSRFSFAQQLRGN